MDERPPSADVKFDKRDAVIVKVEFKNAYSERVRQQCRKRYADGYIGYMSVSLIDRLDATQVEQLDDHIVTLRASWQSADLKGCVLLSNKSAAFFRYFHDILEPFLNWDIPVRALRTLHGGAQVITTLSHPEWGTSNGIPIVVELDNVYPTPRVGGEDRDVIYWNNGYHVMAVMQFLELCRYRGFMGFDHFCWLNRDKTHTPVDMTSLRKCYRHNIGFGTSHQNSSDP